MTKKWVFLALLGLTVLVGTLGGVKALQIRRMLEHARRAVPPPQTVTTARARAESWGSALTAVGTLDAVRGVAVAAELAGRVTEIAFEPGTRVKAGDLLVRQDVSSERAQLPGAEASAALTESNLQRATKLLADGLIARADHDAAVANYRQAVSRLEAIKASIEKKTIRAPFAGRLGIRLVNLGQTLSAGDAIVSLQTLDPIFATFQVPQQELARVRLGMPVRVTTDALPGQDVRGRVTTISPQVDPATRSVRIQATLANPDERLRPGMFVEVAVVLPTRSHVLAIPATAVLYAPYGNSVFVVEETRDGGEPRTVLRQRFVRLGEERGDFIAVVSGLADGETVVSSGVFKLRNGEPVTVDNALAPGFELAPRPTEE